MSLADLLNFGRKVEPKEEPKAPDPVEKQEASATASAAAPKLSQEELDLLREQVDQQTAELAKQEEQEEAAKKRALDDAVEQAAALAKKRREDKYKDIPEGAYRASHCKFFQMGQCEKGLDCPFAHGAENLLTPANQPQKFPTSASSSGALGGNLAQHVMDKLSTVSYKTQWCKFFEVGACTKAEACSYPHNVMELRGTEKTKLLAEQQAMIEQWGNDWTKWGTDGGCSTGVYDEAAASMSYGWCGAASYGAGAADGGQWQSAQGFSSAGAAEGQWQGSQGFSSGGSGEAQWQGCGSSAYQSSAGPPSGRDIMVCTVHNKRRSVQDMVDDGKGGKRCAPGYLCQVGTSASKLPFPAWSMMGNIA